MRELSIFSLAGQRSLQSPFAIRVMMHKAALVADPDLVDFFILARHYTLDHPIAACFRFTACVQCNIRSHRALRADRGGGLQLPRARFEAEIPRCQRADRANVRSVA